MFGLTVEEASGPPVEIFPDNLATVNVFIAMSTQWRYGFGGPTGLDYSGLAFVMDMVGVIPIDRPEVFDGVRTMEDAALEHMSKK